MALNLVTKTLHGCPSWHATSLEDYEEWFDKFQKNKLHIFRGQRKAYPLLPSLGRKTTQNQLLINERKLLKEFKKQASPCLHLQPKTEWDWLIVSQHHGLPTRLLDWSSDPYIALWFALEKAPSTNDSKPTIWCLSPKTEDIIDPAKNTRPFSGTRTKVFEPTFIIPRVRAQKGYFTSFKYINESKHGFIPLEKNKNLRKLLQRIEIAPYAINTISAQLEAMGYTQDSLFPNIDDVAKKVKHDILANEKA